MISSPLAIQTLIPLSSQAEARGIFLAGGLTQGKRFER